MKKLIYTGLAAAFFASCQPSDTQKEVTVDSQIDSVAYGIGMSIGQNLKGGDLGELDRDVLFKGIADVLDSTDLIFGEVEAQAVIRSFYMEKQKSQQEEDKQKHEGNIEIGKKFLAENKAKEGIVETASGLQYEIIQEGEGAKPSPMDQVKVHYHGTTIDGTVFDSSVERGEPVTFGVTQVISGWTEVLQLMTVGSKFKVYIPSELAYGERGAGEKIPPYSTLIFDIELLEIVNPSTAEAGHEGHDH